MSSDVAVSVCGLSKCYPMFSKPQDRLLQMLLLGRRKMYREHWALKDVSFDVPKGQTVGVLGRNGSGKSTLLQIIAGTLNQTAGTVKSCGRITALLELGAGFNPEYSGADNIFLSGAVLGMSRKEIESKFDAIAAFADIGDFLDQPAKTYSSGMYMRLAFSVAASLEPDILIVDEALAVGDAKFQAKCFRKFEEFQNSGGTVLLVTHSTEQVVRNCSSAVLLEAGQVVEQGDPRLVTNRYLDLLFGRTREFVPVTDVVPLEKPLQRTEVASLLQRRIEDRPNYNRDEYRWGNGAAEIVDCVIVSKGEPDVVKIDAGEQVDVYFRVIFLQVSSRPIFGLTIKTPDGVAVFGVNSRDWKNGAEFRQFAAGEEIVVKFSVGMNIAPGEYLVSLGVAEEDRQTGEVIPLDRRYDSVYLLVHSDGSHSGLARLPVEISYLADGALI